MPLFFAGLLEIVGQFISKIVGNSLARVPILTAFFALSIIIVSTYLLAMNTLVAGIQYAVPTIVTDVWSWFMPSNITAVFSAIYGAKIAKWAYVKHLNALTMKAKILAR